ncbi:hypothetical protein [Kurthia huakuii]|uniref:hypothetical protein n=1 Tax=Kurthia huakuii TaxID=1421019 RepID=UPI0004976C66|nr:hypothetical protein [Kurthia huakuii]MBM7698704.1 hypothetical protein [Kurthia huakuii]
MKCKYKQLHRLLNNVEATEVSKITNRQSIIGEWYYLIIWVGHSMLLAQDGLRSSGLVAYAS